MSQTTFLKFPLPTIRATTDELMPVSPIVRVEPDTESDFAAITALLNQAKQPLDDIPSRYFSPLMLAVDMYRTMKVTLKTNYGMQVATNATLKMYELATQMRLLACDTGSMTKIRAFFNAELPGAFLAAVNHYVQTMCPESNFDWVASSYYPDGGTALGDQYGIYSGNRDHWLMGPRPNALPADEPVVTGDLKDPNVVAALADAVHIRFGGASLYASDAGTDVSVDYSRQEELTSYMNYGQVICGLLSLAPGGHLVTKQYTFFTLFSRSLIGLLAAHFDEVYVTKPLTSRPVNSEVYIVAKGFRGIDHKLCNALLDRLARYATIAVDTTPCDWSPLFNPELLRGVDEALLRAARQIHGRQQVAFLNEAVGFYSRFKGCLSKLHHALSADMHRVQDMWLANNPVRRIRSDRFLTTGCEDFADTLEPPEPEPEKSEDDMNTLQWLLDPVDSTQG